MPHTGQGFRDIEYIPGGGERNRLDVFLPVASAKPPPVVLRLHGGAWWAYSKNDVHTAHRLLEHGLAVVTANYRYSRQAGFPAQLEDAKAAVRWIRAHAAAYGLALPLRIGAVGDSAGGHLACLLGTTGAVTRFDRGPHADQSSRVDAVAAWYPPTDFRNWNRQLLENGVPRQQRESVAECLLPLLGGSAEDRPEQARDASPITYVGPDSAPALLLHGTADDVVPHQQSEVFAEALRRVGVESSVLLVAGAGHGGPAFETAAAFDPVAAFLDRHLKGPVLG